MINYWTEEEFDILRAKHKTHTRNELAVLLNRSVFSVDKNLRKLGLSARRKMFLVKTGARYGRLVVIGDSEGFKLKFERRKWWFQCDCGNKKLLAMYEVRMGTTVSCGCYSRENTAARSRKEAGYSSFMTLYNASKTGAKIRNLSFLLTFDDFKLLTQKDCTYCGDKPSIFNIYLKNNRKRKATKEDPSSKNSWEWANIYVNGIDRVDSSKGYEKDNCVPCCSVCNSMKLDRSVNDFLKHVGKIVGHSSPLDTI